MTTTIVRDVNVTINKESKEFKIPSLICRSMCPTQIEFECPIDKFSVTITSKLGSTKSTLYNLDVSYFINTHIVDLENVKKGDDIFIQIKNLSNAASDLIIKVKIRITYQRVKDYHLLKSSQLMSNNSLLDEILKFQNAKYMLITTMSKIEKVNLVTDYEFEDEETQLFKKDYLIYDWNDKDGKENTICSYVSDNCVKFNVSALRKNTLRNHVDVFDILIGTENDDTIIYYNIYGFV